MIESHSYDGPTVPADRWPSTAIEARAERPMEKPPPLERPLEQTLERALDEQPVHEVALASAAGVDPAMPIGQALRLMDQGGHTCLVVVGRRRVVGIFTERDVVRRVAPAGGRVKEQAIATVMTRDPIVIDEDASLGQAARLLAAAGVRHLPVVDHRGQVKGVISPKVVAHYLGEQFA